MKNNLYNEYVDISPDLDTKLKKCFVNHMLLYNQALDYLHKNEELTFKSLKKQIINHLKDKQLTPIIEIALFNELYYQYKKFKRNVRIQKLITDVQYFSFLSKGYTTRSLVVNEDRKSITFEGFEGSIHLDKELPKINEEESFYINLSFSNIENRYMISIYRSN